MERELGENIRARLKQQLLDGLLAANPVEVPKSLVDAQVREMQIEAARRMGATDASQVPPPEPFVEARAPPRGARPAGRRADPTPRHQARPSARRCAPGGPRRRRYPEPDAIIKAYRQNADALRQVENMVIEDQVVDLLLEHAKVTDQPATFKDVMNFGA